MGTVGGSASRRGAVPHGWVPWVAAAIVVIVPIAFGVWTVQSSAIPTNLGVFIQFMSSPVQLLVPLLATALGCSSLYAELGHRHLSNLRPRLTTRTILAQRLFRASIVPFAVLVASALLVYCVSFLIWPLLGNPFIDPSVYFKSEATARADDVTRVSYSELIRFGSFAYGAGYALWYGFGAALYGALGAACLFLIPNRAVAILFPLGLYVVQTIVAALLGSPYAGLLYSLAPFGLDQITPGLAALPTLFLACSIAALWVWIFRNRDELRAVL